MKQYCSLLLFVISINCYAQYPFEAYSSPIFDAYNDWNLYDSTAVKGSLHHQLIIPNFFDDGDSITIQLNSYVDDFYSKSSVQIINSKETNQVFNEQMAFNKRNVFETVYAGDIDGNGLKDLKIVIPFMGTGVASLNKKIIYLFQEKEYSFVKISFTDKMDGIRKERDIDGDGSFEIITMDLNNYGRQRYWTFNLFEYKNRSLINANNKEGYPIMIQYRFRSNYKLTDKITRREMKSFEINLPNEYRVAE